MAILRCTERRAEFWLLIIESDEHGLVGDEDEDEDEVMGGHSELSSAQLMVDVRSHHTLHIMYVIEQIMSHLFYSLRQCFFCVKHGSGERSIYQAMPKIQRAHSPPTVISAVVSFHILISSNDGSFCNTSPFSLARCRRHIKQYEVEISAIAGAGYTDCRLFITDVNLSVSCDSAVGCASGVDCASGLSIFSACSNMSASILYFCRCTNVCKLPITV